MNIQTINKEPFNNIRPTNFLEATIQLAECYKNALAAGTNGDDLGVRYWVDASRTVKAFFKKYQDKEVKEDLVEKLEGNNSKQVLVDSLVVLKCAEPFVNQWVNRFKELSVRNYKKFQDVHWDIFLDFIVPLTWDWQSDVFVMQHKDLNVMRKLIDRGQRRIILIEPDEKALLKLEKEIDNIDQTEQVHVIKSNKEISRIISTWVDNPPYYSRVMSSEIFSDDAEKQEELAEIEELVREGMLNAITFDNTIKSHDMVWIENGLGNFSNLVKYPHISKLTGKFENFSAIIVSPGPSLEKNIEHLKRVSDNALIIAVSHSLQYLSEHDVVPDIVIHVDPNIKVKKYFKTFDMSKVELLILSATTGPEFFDLPSRNKCWVYANAFFDSWLMDLNNIEEYTLYGSCVSVAALKMAYTWGCKKIALVGQDLSFEDDKFYAGSTFAPDAVIDGFEESVKSAYYKLPGYYGGEVLTKNDYRVYHIQFQHLAEDINEQTDIELYNCTEGGANIEGFRNIPLVEFVEEKLNYSSHSESDLSYSDMIGLVENSVNRQQARKNLGRVRRLVDEIEKLFKVAIAKTNQKRSINGSDQSLQKIQKKIARKIKGSMFLKMALQDPLSDLSESEKYENSSDGYLEKGAEMYKACLKVVKKLKIKLSKIKF